MASHTPRPLSQEDCLARDFILAAEPTLAVLGMQHESVEPFGNPNNYVDVADYYQAAGPFSVYVDMRLSERYGRDGFTGSRLACSALVQIENVPIHGLFVGIESPGKKREHPMELVQNDRIRVRMYETQPDEALFKPSRAIRHNYPGNRSETHFDKTASRDRRQLPAANRERLLEVAGRFTRLMQSAVVVRPAS